MRDASTRAKRSRRFSPKALKIIVEKHTDGYVAYPLGLKGVVVGQGNSYEEVIADVKSAIRFHIQTFGKDVLEDESPVLEAFVAEAEVTT
jgi:predicted RNase H-like HicB family nuclease